MTSRNWGSSPSWDSNVVELADRQTHDSDVALHWSRSSGRLWVTVQDKTGDEIARIDATRANALDVFHHPYAYERKAA
jgi:hypothetical protein